MCKQIQISNNLHLKEETNLRTLESGSVPSLHVPTDPIHTYVHQENERIHI
jgi:hypothetical protein